MRSIPWRIAWRIRTLGCRGVRFRWRNFWKEDLREADVVFCYLFPDVLEDLARKLKTDLRPGTPVVSCNFPFPDWPRTALLYPDSSLNGDPIYVYKIPDRTAASSQGFFCPSALDELTENLKFLTGPVKNSLTTYSGKHNNTRYIKN